LRAGAIRLDEIRRAAAEAGVMSAHAIGPAYPHDPAGAREALAELGADAQTPWAAALAAGAANAPYLRRLILRRAETAQAIASEGPEPIVAAALAAAEAAAGASFEDAMRILRQAKADVHLACAAGDLSLRWDLARVTGALSDLAERATASALALAARELVARGDLKAAAEGARGPVPGFIVLAMGKLGARELNYSSDIDLTLFFDPDLIPAPEAGEARRAALRLVPPFVRILEEITEDGYVFRTDLRLRPDPASTQVAVTVQAAEAYYQSVGQNWERAALIKARPIAGDIEEGEAFLKSIAPFIWRRHLDYAAIADIHSIKRQIVSVHKGGDLDHGAPDVKVGRGGIRDIELFVQTQQLILGGRDAKLRMRTTLGALDELARANVIDPETRGALAEAYTFFRAVEHRIQMLEDEQTHRVPRDEETRARLAALCGFSETAAFDRALAARRARVAEIDEQLFGGEESLADPLGSLVFTGVEDHPATLETLAGLGFKQPAVVAAAVRGWHHGRMRATRSERAREILTALMPKLLRAFSESGEPDAAFNRFDDFLRALPAGVQVFSVLQAHPALLGAIADAFGLAPRISAVLARRPALIDSLLESRFAEPLSADRPGARRESLARRVEGGAFEDALNETRRYQREEALRIGLHVLQGRATAAMAGEAYSDLAEACVQILADAALKETERLFGPRPGAFAVVALGKFGGRELSESSDLDIMLVYDAPESAAGALAAPEYYTRLTQRLISALSAQTEEGALYEIDMALRPSGSKGPPAVRLSSFERYYREEAWTWELLALTRLRAVAGDPALCARVAAAARAVLVLPRDARKTRDDAAAMRALMDKERPGQGLWDLKLQKGGLVDIEFIAQTEMIVNAARRPEILHANTGQALAALAGAGVLAQDDADNLAAAWTLYSDLTQILRICVEGAFTPEAGSARLHELLARAAGAADFAALTERLKTVQAGTRRIFTRLIAGP
jgi:glutamate-ammonia-ligase adenylyltransferase